MESKIKLDYWSLMFSLSSLTLGVISILFINDPIQRLLTLSFVLGFLLMAILGYFYNRMFNNEKEIKRIIKSIGIMKLDIIKRFNYLQDLLDIKERLSKLEMKKKKAQINLIDIFRIIIALLLIYVIFEVIRSFV